MEPPGDHRAARFSTASVVKLIAVAALVVAAVTAYRFYADASLRHALLLAYPDGVPADRRLADYAAGLGQKAVAENCVSCHGAELQGDQTKGAPSLTDAIWLFERGDVSDIERTVLYGIRSGHPKARNVTDMPGLGASQQLTKDQVRDVVDYTLSLTTKEGDPAALERGRILFEGDGVCYDCHSRDGAGSPDYGAPSLIDDEWLFGADRDAIWRSVNDGRRGLCPAYIDRLDLPTIRGIAIYVHRLSHPETQAHATRKFRVARLHP